MQYSKASICFRSWAAGYFDGEGCAGWYFSGGSRGGHGVVSIGSTDRKTIRALCGLWGGSIGEPQHRPGVSVKPFYKWQLSGDRAREFLKWIRPFTLLKSKQIDVFLSMPTNPPGRHMLSAAHVRERRRKARLLRALKRQPVN